LVEPEGPTLVRPPFGCPPSNFDTKIGECLKGRRDQPAGKSGLGESGGRKKITPGGWERRTGMRLRFVYRRTGPSLLVADDSRINKKGLAVKNRRKSGQATTVVFLLVPQVSLCKRLDIDAIVRTWTGRVPSLIAQYWSG
jgi:hypothetical protein